MKLLTSPGVNPLRKNAFVIVVLCSAFVFSGCASVRRLDSTATSNAFDYLAYKDDALQSTHALKFSLEIPRGFQKIEPLHHQAVFNEHPFNVSVAGLIGEKTILAVHAEQVTDDSVFLDYSYMEAATLDGIDFYMKAQCLELPDSTINGAADLRYFKENGFDFHPAVYLKQYFRNAADGNSEYVLSYGRQVSDCTDKTITDIFKHAFNEELEQTVVLREIK